MLIKKLLIIFLFSVEIYFSAQSKSDVISDKVFFETFTDYIYEKDKYLRLYIADEPLEKELGLMHVEKLNPNQGMIFVFNPPERVNFWMKNTLIPLDMIFIKDNKIIEIFEDVLPCSLNRCPLYGSQEKIDYVIELNSGKAREIGFKIGQDINLKI